MEFKKAKKKALEILKTGLSKEMYFHTVGHTKDVYKAAIMLAKLEGIDKQSKKLLKTAAMYHDVGYTIGYKDHENEGIKIARDILPSFTYSPDQIDVICNMIAATEVPQKPNNLLEQIMCDADLDYLGRDDYYPLAAKLEKEFVVLGIIQPEEWLKIQIGFLSSHQFFTNSARRLRSAKKAERLDELKDQYDRTTQ